MYALDPITNTLTDPAMPGAVALDAAGALVWLQRHSGRRVRAPIGVIGPREEDEARNRTAEAVGRMLAGFGFTVICGGRGGVMQAVCRGVSEAGGLSIGLLPEPDPGVANPYVGVPVATGIGEARNAIIAQSAALLIVIGDSYGTLSEVALGLRFGKTVLGLCAPPKVEGVVPLARVEDLPQALADALLA